MVSGTVMSRVKDFEGQPIGKADKNLNPGHTGLQC